MVCVSFFATGIAFNRAGVHTCICSKRSTSNTLRRLKMRAQVGLWWTLASSCFVKQVGSIFGCGPCWSRWQLIHFGCTGDLWVNGQPLSFQTTNLAFTGVNFKCNRALRASIPRAYTTPLNKRKITIRMAFLFGAGCPTCEMFQTHGCLSPRLCRRTCKLTHLLPFKFPSHWLIWRWLHASPNSYFTPDVKIQR